MRKVLFILIMLLFILKIKAQNTDLFFNNKSSVEIHLQKIFPASEKEIVKKLSYQDDPVMQLTSGDEYTDFGFTFSMPNTSGAFHNAESGIDNIDVTASFRIIPKGSGTYIIPDGNCDAAGKPPAKEGRISIVFNNDLVISNQKTGTNGSITIDKYPQQAGGYLIGSFTATLGDSPNPCEKKNLYKAWGIFNIMLIR